MNDWSANRDGNLPLQGDTDRDPVEELASEFAERYRSGDHVTIEEYAARYPKLAREIRELFPTIAAMERLSTKRTMESALTNRSQPKQLGDYRIIEEIARGGMGIVYEAEQISLGRRVAVKVLPSHALSRAKDLHRFQREARTAAGLHHSNIVPVFGVGEDNGRHYIVMQLIRGVGLDEVLNEVKHAFVDGSESNDSSITANRFSAIVRSAANLIDSDLPMRSTQVACDADTVEIPRETVGSGLGRRPVQLRLALTRDYFRNVAKIGLQAAEALQYAHQHNTLHRDIKPGNLILDEDGRVWIADFGLAKAVHDSDVTRSGDVVGTIAYVAPERFNGNSSKSSDTYGLGVTLYEMLTLQKAFAGRDRLEVLHQITHEALPNPRKLNDAVPLDLETIVMKAVAKDPEDRYASAGALARDLQAFLDDRPIEARRLSYAETVVRWSRRNRPLAAMACGVVCLAVAVMGLLAFGYRHSEQQRARAENTADHAIDVIQQIYSHFAPNPISAAGFGEDTVNDLSDPVAVEHMPISKNTALLLENLLDFYDVFAADTTDTDAVAIKAISANRRVGDIHRRLDQLDDAKLSYQKAIRRIEDLSPDLRQTEAMRLETARTYNGLGLTMIRNWSGSYERVEAHGNAVEVLDHRDVSKDEEFELATSLYLLHLARKQIDKSLKRPRKDKHFQVDTKTYLAMALEILGGLTEASPGHAGYELLYARCLLADGTKSKDPLALSENQNRGIEILNRLVSEYPENPEYQFELGKAYLHTECKACLGQWHTSQLIRSELRLRQSLAATANLEIHHPNIPKYYQLKKDLNERLGRLLKAQSKFSEADDCYQRAIQMQNLLMAHAENPEFHRPWLYWLQQDFGRVLVEANELSRADKVLRETVDGLEAIVNDPHSTLGWYLQAESRRHLESAYRSLAKVARKSGDDSLAAVWKDKAEELDE